MNDQPWILGISASHNGSACLLRGDVEIVVAIQEERLTRFKRHRIRGSGTASRCLLFDYAGIAPSDLSLVVLCIQGRAQDKIHDITLDPFLNVITHGIPTITIPHHYGHAVSVFAIPALPNRECSSSMARAHRSQISRTKS